MRDVLVFISNFDYASYFIQFTTSTRDIGDPGYNFYCAILRNDYRSYAVLCMYSLIENESVHILTD